MELNAKNKCLVLFRDYNSLWCPLSDLYWSLQSLSLLSRHPISTVEEIVSNYCPQCLSRYTEDEVAASSGHCPTCKLCPCCESIVTVDTDGLVCGLCYWRSADVPSTPGVHKVSVSSEAYALVQANLKSACNKAEIGGQITKVENHLKVWQMEELRMKLESAICEDGMEESKFLQRLAEVCNRSAGDAADADSLKSLTLCPTGVPLLTKKALRSRQDARSGRMNILMQPKTLPLEGDSSLKLQKGKWWVKDSAAIHDLPFVSLLSLPTQEQLRLKNAACIIVLCLTNPKMSDITVSFRADTLSPGAADYLFYSSASEEAQWVHATDRVCLQVSRDLRDSDDSSSGDSSSSGAALDIAIGAFEDELLKDASEEVPVPVQGPAAEQRQATAGAINDDGFASTPAGSAGRWTHRVVHNKAYISIPVCVPDHVVLSDIEDCAWEVNLQYSANLGGSASVEIPFKILFS